MADEQLDILINVKADLAAAQATVAELKELKRQAVAAGVSTGDLDKQIASAERQADQFQKKVEEAGKKGTEPIHGMRRAVAMLGHQFGELGSVVTHFAGSLPALGIAAFAIVVGKVAEHFANVQKAIEETAKKMDEFDLTKIRALRDATQEAAIAMAQYVAAMDRAGESKDPFGGKKFATKEEELAARLGKRDELDKNAYAARAAADAIAKDPALRAAKAKLVNADTEEAKLKEAARLADDPKTIKKNQAIVAQLTKEFGPHSPEVDRAIQNLKALTDTRDKAAAALNAHSREIEGNKGIVTDFEQRRIGMESFAGARAAEAQANRTRVVSLQEDIAEESRPRTDDRHGKMLLEAAAGADTINAGGRATAGQADAINAAAKVFGLTQINSKKLMQILGRLNDNQSNLDAAMARYEGQLKTIQRTHR